MPPVSCLQTKAMVEDVAEQVTQSLLNALAIVKEAGLDARNIVKTTVFVKSFHDFSRVNGVYQAFFREHNASFPIIFIICTVAGITSNDSGYCQFLLKYSHFLSNQNHCRTLYQEVTFKFKVIFGPDFVNLTVP
ncbi:MAG: Rid family hydrolase [Psychromonas sp.]